MTPKSICVLQGNARHGDVAYSAALNVRGIDDRDAVRDIVRRMKLASERTGLYRSVWFANQISQRHRRKILVAHRPISGLKPIRVFLDGTGIINFRIASNTALKRASYFVSSSSTFRARSACVPTIARNRTKARM